MLCCRLIPGIPRGGHLEEGCSIEGFRVCLTFFRNWLPSKTNLFLRGIISPETQLCVSGCGQQESETHLFLTCRLFGQLWQLVRNWLSVYSADPSNIVDHFYQFGTSFGFGKS
jgi:hypothetical protein